MLMERGGMWLRYERACLLVLGYYLKREERERDSVRLSIHFGEEPRGPNGMAAANTSRWDSTEYDWLLYSLKYVTQVYHWNTSKGRMQFVNDKSSAPSRKSLYFFVWRPICMIIGPEERHSEDD